MKVEGGQGQRIPRLAVVNIEMSAGDFKNGNISRELGRLRICLLMEGIMSLRHQDLKTWLNSCSYLIRFFSFCKYIWSFCICPYSQCTSKCNITLRCASRFKTMRSRNIH
jgi:hypothetical protein